jgi:hypothetical protein
MAKLSDPNSEDPYSSNAEKLMAYNHILKDMEQLMDRTDKRLFTVMSINKLQNELRQVIIGLSELRKQRLRNSRVSIEAILANLRRAQDELYVAADMLEAKGKFTESRSRSFYKCLSNFQDYLFQALQDFS